jgi:hypothetical protein
MAGLFNAPFGEGQFAEAFIAANVARQRTKPDEDKVFAAFGRFVAACALAEASFHVAARHFSGMPEEKARIVFNGMRIGDVIERIRALTKDTDDTIWIEDLYPQFNLIHDERDQFVHRLVEFQPGAGLRITNRLTSKSVTTLAPRIFSLAEIEAMTHDCEVISSRLIAHWGAGANVHSRLSLIEMFGPWRYRRPQPDAPNPPDRGARKESRRQQRPSPKSRLDREPKS